jgi:5-methylcytosine-specific restriction endonuclease McrA
MGAAWGVDAEARSGSAEVNQIAALNKAAAAKGLRVIQCNEHHFQIVGGPLLVNYYPTTRNSSAYVAGTRQAIKHVTPERAVEMAMNAPKIQAPIAKKRPTLTKHKRRLMKKSRLCYWCGVTTFDPDRDGPCDRNIIATVDHKIPRSRGGLDHSNNYVLSCKKCNEGRANEMPELRPK